MTKIQNPIKCPYCLSTFKNVQISKGFFLAACDCEPVPKIDNLNLSGGKRQAPDQLNDTRTKKYFYV